MGKYAHMAEQDYTALKANVLSMKKTAKSAVRHDQQQYTSGNEDNMEDNVTRPELDAKLETLEARMDTRVARIESKIDAFLARSEEREKRLDERFAHIDQRFAHIDQRFSHVDQQFAEIRGEYKSLRATILGTVLPTGLAVVAIILAAGVQMFDSGRDTAQGLRGAETPAERQAPRFQSPTESRADGP